MSLYMLNSGSQSQPCISLTGKVNFWNQVLSLLNFGERNGDFELWLLLTWWTWIKIALMGTGKCNPDEGDSGGEHKHDWKSIPGSSISGWDLQIFCI